MSDKPISDYTDALEARIDELEADLNVKRADEREAYAVCVSLGKLFGLGDVAPVNEIDEAVIKGVEQLKAEVAHLAAESANASGTVAEMCRELRHVTHQAQRRMEVGQPAALTPPPAEQRMTVATCFPCLGAGRHDHGGGISSKCAACAGTGLQGPHAAGDADE